MNKFSNLNDALKWRYATRKYDLLAPLSDEEVGAVLEAGNLIPTSYGLQPFRFVVVKDRARKLALVEQAYGQTHIGESSHLVVLAIEKNVDEAFVNEYVERTAKTRGVSVEQLAGFRDMMLGALGRLDQAGRDAWARNQAYIALGAMIAKASEMGIDNHALEAFDAAKFDDLLGLEKRGLHAVVLLELGHRSADDADWAAQAKVRRSMAEMHIAAL